MERVINEGREDEEKQVVRRNRKRKRTKRDGKTVRERTERMRPSARRN